MLSLKKVSETSSVSVIRVDININPVDGERSGLRNVVFFKLKIYIVLLLLKGETLISCGEECRPPCDSD